MLAGILQHQGKSQGQKRQDQEPVQVSQPDRRFIGRQGGQRRHVLLAFGPPRGLNFLPLQDLFGFRWHWLGWPLRGSTVLLAIGNLRFGGNWLGTPPWRRSVFST